ncbi:uncharacterized protein LOC105692341 isoform X1 [Athalia rosae]|uniref:uncharacterized protein LOC105692341 isoform X1 n=1 Tax=Athalia rosae TaxID=37344 RepID=UPI0020340CEF|nr:uncharacterized protein LOC105692341 isoform X1 [Athalia rosae]
MCLFKKSITVICMCYTIVCVAGFICEEVRVNDTHTSSELSPGFLQYGKLVDGTKEVIGLKAKVRNRTENSTLFLLANPFIKVKKDCPAYISKCEDFREYHLAYDITVGADENERYIFAKIFTGCYYFVLRTKSGKIRSSAPYFQNTSYHFYDTRLRIFLGEDYMPDNIIEEPKLTNFIHVPNTCFRLRAKLFMLDRLERANVNPTDEIEEGRISATQDCTLISTGSNNCTISPLTTNVRFEASTEVDENGDGWEAVITWTHLKRGGAYYCVKFTQYNDTCDMKYADLMTWVPSDNIITCNLVHHNESNNHNGNGPDADWGTDWKLIQNVFLVLVGLAVIATLIYWMWKYRELIFSDRVLSNFNLGVDHIEPEDYRLPYDKKESNQILLIYAKESEPFMKTMKIFKNRLQQGCGCHVHDLYSVDEFDEIAKLGGSGWVEDRLRDGCKVVWVDTPKFRSQSNRNKMSKEDQTKYPEEDDFRAAIIPYAITIATSLFQNATTQYRRHFVVRMTGFEVEDGPNDPLLTVSPYTRYWIPVHFSLLCHDLISQRS